MTDRSPSRSSHPLRNIRAKGWENLRPLIEERKALGVPSATIAAHMGTHPSNLSKYERGRATVTDATVQRYRAALDTCRRLIDEADAHLERVREMHDADDQDPRAVPLSDDGGVA